MAFATLKDKVPRINLEAEKATLGALLLDAEAWAPSFGSCG
jgi:replicative DNA helicase